MLQKLDGAIVAAAMVAISLWTAPASGEEAVASAPLSAVPASNPFGLKVVDPAVLARQRGGTESQVLNDMKLNGVVTDNRASNLTTGNNVITDGAFAGVNGVPLVVQNSGNNVLIQNATIVNVQVK